MAHPAASDSVTGRSGEILVVARTSDSALAASAGARREGWLLTYTVAGRRRYEVSGATFDATAATLALLGPRAWRPRRPFRLSEPWDAWYLRFLPSRDWSTPRGFARLAEDVHVAHAAMPSTRARIEDAFARLEGDLAIRRAAHAIGQVGGQRGNDPSDVRRELLLMTLREIFLLVEEEPRIGRQLDGRVSDALERMSGDLRARHTVGSLARDAGLSPSRFAHLFREELGLSPVRGLRRMRLREAAVQLRYTDQAVAAIAEHTGFTSPSHLSREFRREYGVGPLAYRARMWGRRS